MKKFLLTFGLASAFCLGANATTEVAETVVLQETCIEKIHVYVDGVYVGSFEMEVPGSDCGSTGVWLTTPKEEEVK